MGIITESAKLIKSAVKAAPVTKSINLTQRSNAVLKGLSDVGDCTSFSKTVSFQKSLKAKYPQSEIIINGENFSKYDYSQMGSNPAFWVSDKNGGLFYVKYAKDAEKQGHLESEVLTSKLYRLAGISTPEMEMCEIAGGLKGIKSKYLPIEHPTDLAAVQDCFGADAWLAHWDTLMDGNTMMSGGKIVKVDCGGALKYRAQGKLKPKFGEKVDELVTMTDGCNITARNVYGRMSQSQLISSLKKVTGISEEAITGVVKDEGLAATLISRKNYLQRVLNEVEKCPRKENEPMAQYLAAIDKKFASDTENFTKNCDAVTESINAAKRKPLMTEADDDVYKKMTREEKVVSAYVTDDFSAAVNQFARNGKNHRMYEWYAKYGLNAESLPKFKQALKYALEGLQKYQGKTYRWQPAGSFEKTFGKIKTGEIIEDPAFLSTSQGTWGIDLFRSRLLRGYDGIHPEIVIVKSKNGRILPAKISGFRAYEKEVLYNADTRYRYLGEKTINSPSEIEGFEETIKMSEEDCRGGFIPGFKAIYLEEV